MNIIKQKVLKNQNIESIIEIVKSKDKRIKIISVEDNNETYVEVSRNIERNIEDILKEDLHDKIEDTLFLFVFHRGTNREFKIHGFLLREQDYILSLNRITGDITWYFPNTFLIEKVDLYKEINPYLYKSIH